MTDTSNLNPVASSRLATQIDLAAHAAEAKIIAWRRDFHANP